MSCFTHASFQNADKIKAKIMSKLIKISLIVSSLAFGHNIYAKGVSTKIEIKNDSAIAFAKAVESVKENVHQQSCSCTTVSRGTATLTDHAAQAATSHVAKRLRKKGSSASVTVINNSRSTATPIGHAAQASTTFFNYE